MFCKKCGTEMDDNAQFCPKCGTSTSKEEVTETKRTVEDNTAKFQLKPTFNIPYKLITTTGRALLYVILILFLFFDVEVVFIFYPIILGIIVAIAAIYVVIKMIFEKLQYEKMEYNFYNTKVQYIDGFLNVEEKELKYKYVREVTMSQNILERAFNIGTIRIFTNATSGVVYTRNGRHNNAGVRNGIYIHCVENVQENYKKVKELMDQEME